VPVRRSYFGLLKDQQESTLFFGVLMRLLSDSNEVCIHVAVSPEECAETVKDAGPVSQISRKTAGRTDGNKHFWIRGVG
jgi:hypothetical protein